MRLLLNALNADNRSGTGRYITELTKALLQADGSCDCRFLWPRTLPAPMHSCEERLIRVPASPLFRIPFEQIGLALPGRCAADLLHFPTGIGPRFSRLPVVLTVHDLCFFHHPEWFSRSRALYYRAVMAAAVRRADHLIADSQATAADLMQFLHVDEARIAVIPLGVDRCFQPADDEACARVRLHYGLPERFFLFVGTLEPRKNLARLVAAYHRVQDKAPPLVLAGRHGWGASPLAAADDTTSEIIQIGHVPQEQLPALYSAAEAFVWPSLMEGFGLPPLEAMACGTPVITSTTSSLPEVTGAAALLVDPLSVDAIADAMVALAEDAALRDRLRQKGLKQAAGFTWRKTAENTIRVYEKVYAGRQV